MNRNNVTYCFACFYNCIMVVYRKGGAINDGQQSTQHKVFVFHFIKLQYLINATSTKLYLVNLP